MKMVVMISTLLLTLFCKFRVSLSSVAEDSTALGISVLSIGKYLPPAFPTTIEPSCPG
jgi:hypothetical protein